MENNDCSSDNLKVRTLREIVLESGSALMVPHCLYQQWADERLAAGILQGADYLEMNLFPADIAEEEPYKTRRKTQLWGELPDPAPLKRTDKTQPLIRLDHTAYPALVVRHPKPDRTSYRS